MRITSFQVEGIRSIEDSGGIELGDITLLVGRNNSGKSTLLRCLLSLQENNVISATDIRHGIQRASLVFNLEDVQALRFWKIPSPISSGSLRYQISRDGAQSTKHIDGQFGHQLNVGETQRVTPNNLFFPYLSGRKVGGYSETVNLAASTEVGMTLQNLVARVDTFMNPNHPTYEHFMQLLNDVIGLKISTIPTENGKRVGVWLNPSEAIFLEQMGDGVAQLLGLICSLCSASGQIFLIEEIENDLHPEALKALLKAIEQRRDDNQFVISTHNNIVLRNLGSLPNSRIYDISLVSAPEQRNIPTSQITAAGSSPQDRIRILKELGYELSDLELWDGWLILEESSAERIIRDHLIPWFAPSLTRVRTLAANGTGDVDRTFDTIYKMVLFTHLEERYRGRIMVILDGDPSGLNVTSQLKRKFSAWESAFRNFTQPDFELYYPPRFQTEAKRVLELRDRKLKKDGKKELLADVLTWIESNSTDAKAEFESSAAEVIELLRAFEGTLGPASKDVMYT